MMTSRRNGSGGVNYAWVALLRGALALGLLVGSGTAASAAQAAKTPLLAWSPSTNGGYDFGTLDASTGQSASQTFTLTNTDGKASGAVTITLSGSPALTKTADNCTGKNLAPKKSCGLTVKYAPTTNGSDTAALSATSNKGATANLALTGASAWQNGDVITYSQSGWDTGGSGESTLGLHFFSVYGSTSGVVEIGIPGASGFSMSFSGYSAVFDYLPALGPFAALDADLSDPSGSSSGELGGEVLALQLNVDFSDAGYTLGNAGLPFGDLTLCGVTTLPTLNGLTVRDFLALENTLLGGGSNGYTIADLALIIVPLNASFAAGTADTFAQTHLFPGACP
jgi:hypothetical protein